MVNRPHILTTAKEGTDCAVTGICLREGVPVTAFLKPTHLLAKQVEKSQDQGSNATFQMGWRLVKSQSVAEIVSERFIEHPTDIYLSKPRLLNECFEVTAENTAALANTCNFDWCEISGLKDKTLLELAPIFAIFGRAHSIFLFGTFLANHSSKDGEVITARTAMCFDIAVNTGKRLYFYECNNTQWYQYNYGKKKTLQVCEKVPQLSNCCAIVGIDDMYVKSQAYFDLFTLLCSYNTH